MIMNEFVEFYGPWMVPLLGIVALIIGYVIYKNFMRFSPGEEQVAKLGDQIHRAAMTFMFRELKVMSIFTVVIGLLVGISPLGWPTAIAFFVGAIASAAAGFIGMYTATKANVRTAVAARDHGATQAMSLSFFGGSVMGLAVAAMGLLGIGLLFIFLIVYATADAEAGATSIEGFAMGASVVALFYRVGGGIFTKAADVGADLVGKVEEGIPEDDPRNPGVIADNVGDNVGDVAGMGSDLFESYCGSQIAVMIITATMSAGAATALLSIDAPAEYAQSILMLLPLLLTSTGLICSLIAFGVVKGTAHLDPSKTIQYGQAAASIMFMILSLVLTQIFGISIMVWLSIFLGTLGGVVITIVTNYYTNGPPVRMIGRSGKTGVATVIINGFAVGLQSIVFPVVVIAVLIFVSYAFAGVYGIGIAAVGLLSTIAMTMAIDAYGPVADNAGGIAEMSEMGPETRKITDKLDSVGNTTAAIGKGFAISAAGLAALTMVLAFIEVIERSYPGFTEGISVANPMVLAGLFLGALTAYFNGSITMRAVGSTAFEMIEEIRRQFREKPGILKYEEEPDPEKCVAIAADGAMKRLVWPALLAIAMPLGIGFVLGAEALAGLLAGALISCAALALFMANAGGAWDNAKKYIEEGHEGGKGSEAHAATVVGDTVGDPLKDTSGPSMNILINVMAIWSVVMAPLLQPQPFWEQQGDTESAGIHTVIDADMLAAENSIEAGSIFTVMNGDALQANSDVKTEDNADAYTAESSAWKHESNEIKYSAPISVLSGQYRLPSITGDLLSNGTFIFPPDNA